MSVDESFAEYVAARWSMLYRLAVLLVGEEEADALTQTALVGAHAVWSEVQAAASADDRVKLLLASTFVRDAKEGEVSPPALVEQSAEAAEHERLWAVITSLPRRQRAVLVLRHYEGLSDADIAGVVGSSTSAVTAEARALEVGLDLEDLRTELLRRAEDPLVPLPPIGALVERSHQAQRERRRRVLSRTAIAAAVVVVGLAVTTVVQGRSSDPSRPDPDASAADELNFLSSLPDGARPEFAYSVGDFLYLPGGRGVQLDETPSAIAEAGDWVYVAYLSGRIVRVGLKDPAVEPVAETSGGQLVADRGGSRLAWLASDVGAAEVHLESANPAYPVVGDDSQLFPARLRCCDNPFEINGITRDGEVVASLPVEGRVWVWDTDDPGSRVREITGIGNGVVSQVLKGALVVHDPPFQYAAGRIEDGAFLRVAEIAAVDADFSDPQGHRIVYADTAGEIHVREVTTRGRSRRGDPNIRLQLPTIDDGFSAVVWEDSFHVVLDVSDETAPDGALVRCNVTDGVCELADELEGPHLLPR